MDTATSHSDTKPESLVSRLRALMTGRARLAVLYGVPALAVLGVIFLMLTAGRYQETDNAYVQAARVPISTSISGRVIEVLVTENQRVSAGEALFRLDRDTSAADVAQLEAVLTQAQARVYALRADYRSQIANVRARREGVAFARTELRRARQLSGEGIASRQDVDTAQHALQQAESQLIAADQARIAALVAIGGDPNIEVAQHAGVREAAARLERARLALSYTEVLAPQAGVVTRVDQVQVGTFVNTGQPLFWLIAGEPWVEANFKEDQIENMRPGQSAELRIDTFGGRRFEARVASFSPGTGSTFSPLPAQNATGNWVKVVQRIPVRLVLVDPPEDLNLRAGLSVHVRVDTRSTPDRLRGR